LGAISVIGLIACCFSSLITQRIRVNFMHQLVRKHLSLKLLRS
jgi:hypothetical protein